MPEELGTIFLGVGLGIGLAAACGFRVFVPLLVAGAAAKAGLLPISLAEGFEWLATWPAIITLGAATVLELAAYYIPWLDNLLDTISTPAAIIAGVLAAAACVTEMDPLLKWTVAAIVGGGSAGIVKAGMVGLRALSTTITGGVGNVVVATFEWLVALALSVFAVVAPIFAGILGLAIVVFLTRFAYRCCRKLFGPREPAASTAENA